MNQFESRVHNARRTEGELDIQRFGDIWMETQVEMLGDSVDVGDEYRTWWSYVPHFIDVPGYVYAYAFGNLLAISVYSMYVQEGEGFVSSYLEMLRAGGSKSPEDLAKMVDCDLTDPSFWERGLALVEGDIAAAEEAAAAAGLSGGSS
jgi:oligoendopeptidase F